MASAPTSGQVYNQAAAMHQDSRTPGLNSFISAWFALQDFTGNWAVGQYNAIHNVANLIGGFAS